MQDAVGFLLKAVVSVMKNKDLALFAKYTSLNVIGMIGMSVYILADTFFIANGVGANGLTALNLALPIFNLVNGTGLMLAMGGATKYNVCKSRGDSHGMDSAFVNTMYAAAFFSAVYMLCGALFSVKIASALGANSEVLQSTAVYLKVIMLFSPAFICNNIAISFVRNDGAPALSTAAMTVGSLSNIVMDYIFVYPLAMGIFGAVLATGFSPCISMLILSSHKIRGKNGFHFRRMAPSFKVIGNVAALGVPSLITELSVGIVILVFNMIILRLAGNIGVAAYGVISNMSLVVVSVYTGVAQGMQPLSSRAHGEGNFKSARKFFKYACVTAVAGAAVIYPLLACFANPITSVFNSENNATLQQIAVQGLRLYYIATPFLGFNVVLTVFLTSVENPRPAQALSILRGIAVIVPVAFALSAAFGMAGVWCSFPASEFICAVFGIIVLAFFFKKQSAKSKNANA